MGLNLRTLREQKGYTGYYVADQLGVSHVAYYNWETGKAYPSAEKLPALAALFCCRIDDLYAPRTSIPTEGGVHNGA